MGAQKMKTHLVTIRVKTDKPILRKHAVYTAWNHLQDHTIYGGGKDDANEPFGEGKITVVRQ